MEFRILGPLEVVDEGRSLPLGGARQRALLAALLLRANTVVPADRLLDEVWADDPPASGLRSVQVYISQLRKLLGDGVIETRAPGYVLRAAGGELDLHRFERLVADARTADAASAAAKLREALGLWRGAPLADFAYAAFAQTEIGRLEELRVAAFEARIDADTALGRHAELVGELEALVRQHPHRERLREQLMLVLYRSGRQADALEAYQEARRFLVEELGIEPGRQLRDLEAAILRQDPALDLRTPAATEPSRGIFVGRQPELAELIAGLENAIEGNGRLFLLAGEPGIGKSRLADELLALARTRGARVLVGRSWEAGGAPPYWPWVQALRSYVREGEPDSLPALLADVPDPRALEPEAARFRLFDATAEFLRSASRAKPVVLFLDDLHAADAPSLLLLQFLARELADARMLVVAAYRDVDPTPSHALRQLLAEVAREPVTRRLPLARLRGDDVSEYVAQAAQELASPEVVAAVNERTEGNPLFVAETVRLLALEGGGAPAIPEGVRDVIARRLGHLSAECNGLLVLAAVLGREFELDALARLAETSVDELLDALDEAVAARIVSDVPGAVGRLRFAHVLIRDTLYDALTTPRRVRLHRRALEELESMYGAESGPHLAELAYHAVAGSDFDRGLDYAHRAGDRALTLLAYEEAARLYTTALEALELARPNADSARCELLLALGDAEGRAGSAERAKEAFVQAADLARAQGWARELARAAVGYGGRIVFDRAAGDRLLVPLLEEALAALGEEDRELRVRLLARLAGALRDEHSRERRERVSHEAVELARAVGEPAAIGYALDGRAAAIWGPDTIDECLAVADELLEVAARSDDLEHVSRGHVLRVHVHVVKGDLAAADEELATATEIAEQLGQPAKLWEVWGIQAMLALGRGRFDAAEALVERAFEHGGRAQPGMAIPVHRLHHYSLCDHRGGHEQLETGLAELARDRPARPMFRCVLAHLHARLGRAAEAAEALRALTRDDAAELPRDAEWLFAMSFLAETAAVLADEEAAATLYPLLLPWAAFNAADVGEGIRGSVARYLGLLAATVGRVDDARRHLEQAVAHNEAMGLEPWVAYTQRDLARL